MLAQYYFFYWAWYYIFAYGNLQGFISIFGDFGFANIFGFLLSQLSSTKRNGYAIRERDIIFKRGFIYKKTTIVPFNRVQHVSIERDFPDKILGISTLRLFTAGGSGSDISIPGLIPQIANNMKEEISKRISSDE